MMAQGSIYQLVQTSLRRPTGPCDRRILALLGLLLLPVFSTRCSDSPARREPPGLEIGPIAAENARALGLLSAGDAKAAVEILRRVVEALPEAPDAHVNLAIAYTHAQDLERTDEQAADHFQQALALRPDHPHALYGLAILALEDNRPDEAASRLRSVTAHDPTDPDVHYLSGRVQEALRTKAQAMARQAEANNQGAMAEQHRAAVARHLDQAIRQYRRAIELQPAYSSAYYNLGLLIARARPADPAAREEAKALLAKNQELQQGGKINRFWGNNYSERGKYALAIRMFGRGDSAQIVETAAMPEFRDATSEIGLNLQDGPMDSSSAGLAGTGPCLVFFDRDGDGDDDLLYAGADGDGRGACRLFLNQDGRFEEASEQLPREATREATAAVAGDIDRDGRLDLYLTRRHGGQLLLNRPEGFQIGPEVPRANSSGWAMPCFVDFDHDGDLDIYVPSASAGSARLLRNLGDDSWEDRSSASALGALSGPAFGSVWLDADNDGDIDAVVPTVDGPIHHFENRRHQGHVRHDIAINPPGSVALTAGDIDNDGWIDLVATRPSPPVCLLLLNKKGVFEGAPLNVAPLSSQWSAAWGAALADLDHDGDLDLVLAGQEDERTGSLALLTNDGTGNFGRGRPRFMPLEHPGRAVTVVDLDQDHALDLVVATLGGPVVFLRNEAGNRLNVLPVRLVDADEAAATGRRRDGPTTSPATQESDVPIWTRTITPGAKLQMQSGRFYQKRDVRTASGFFAQSTRMVYFGLGDREHADAVEIEWPSGTLQAVMDLPANQVARIAEYDVRRGSCPFLFVWDGREHRFWGDVLAASPPGLFIRPGVFATCDPDEWIRIPGDVPATREGHYELIVHESLQEVAYLDLVELWAVDIPQDSQIFPNERFTGSPPFPDHALYLVRDRFRPREAIDHRGRDVRPALLDPDDGRVVADFERLDTPGFAEPHHIEVDFGRIRRLDEGERLVLFLHGYLKFPGSPSQYDAFQRGLRFRLPSLERLDANGAWQMVTEVMGAPAGFSRTMTYDVTNVASEDPAALDGLRLRIATNIEVYWDAAFLAPVPADPSAHIREQRLRLASARLSAVGFPAMAPSARGRSETYRYGAMLAVPHVPRPDQRVRWNRMIGQYTRFGDVAPLVLTSDDMFVIFGPGEQVHLRFDANSAPPPPDGMKRTYLLKLDGWVKDQFYHTATSTQVWPLPFHGMTGYPVPAADTFPWTPARRQWHAKYNTRVIGESESF